MLAGNILDWRGYIPGPWLLEHVPELDSEKKGEMHGLAYHLAPGTEDIDAENSLDWRPVTHYLSVPLKPYRTPGKRQVHKILDFIFQSADAGRPVCVQGAWNGVPDAIAGWYLVARGFTGKQALEELARLRQDTYEPWRLAPARLGLRRLVKLRGR